MKIAIIGAGFTGLAASLELLKNGHDVTIFERDEAPGGLAVGFKVKEWDWTLEYHYHHWFTNDKRIINLAKELGYPVIVKRPKTSVYVDSHIYQLDSPLQVLKFAKLSLIERVRMGVALGLLRFDPYWRPLERFKATEILPHMMGERPYKMLWEPLLKGKFGKYMDEISLAWFWARISKRTPSLAYPEKGYLAFANHIVKAVKERGGTVRFGNQVIKIESGKKVTLTMDGKTKKGEKLLYDKVIVTLPSFFFTQIAPQLPESYKKSLLALKGLGAVNMIIRLKKKFFNDNTYWLSICDKEPVLAVVEHTNFMDNKHYNNEHLVYVGNYLPNDHAYFKMSEKDLLHEYDPFLKKLNPSYRKNLIDFYVFKANFAQPIVPVSYSKMIPPFTTPLKNVFLANIQQVYPWDRGTTYAVELGEKVARLILSS